MCSHSLGRAGNCPSLGSAEKIKLKIWILTLFQTLRVKRQSKRRRANAIMSRDLIRYTSPFFAAPDEAFLLGLCGTHLRQQERWQCLTRGRSADPAACFGDHLLRPPQKG